MPQIAKVGRPKLAPRLYLRSRKDRAPFWVIRDGHRELAAGPNPEKAAQHLAAYVTNAKHYARKRRVEEIDSSDAEMFIYFVEVCAADRPVKIGIAKDVRARFWNLGVGCPFDLAILASISGTLHWEQVLHTRLVSSRIRGEWYRRTAEVEAVIEAARTGTLLDLLGGWALAA